MKRSITSMPGLIFHPEMGGTKIKRFLMNAFAKPTQIYWKPIQTRNSSLGVSMISDKQWRGGRGVENQISPTLVSSR